MIFFKNITFVLMIKGVVFILIGFWVGLLTFSTHTISRKVYLSINDSIPDLNRGGCGYFAYKLFQRLNKNRNSIVIIEHGKHIMIWDKIENMYIDSYGFHTKLDIQLHYGHNIEEIPEDSLKKLLYVDRFWNKTFCREDTIMINNFVSNL